MSDVMLLGVLNMPRTIWQRTELDEMQRESYYKQAAARIQSDADRMEQLVRESDYWKEQAELADATLTSRDRNIEDILAESQRRLERAEALEAALKEARGEIMDFAFYSDVMPDRATELLARIDALLEGK